MYNALFYLFVAYAFVSVYVQTANLAVKQFTSPTIAGLVAVCAVIGLVSKRIGRGEGLLFAAAWALAACGDIFFEMSRLSSTPEAAGRFFVIAVGFFLVAYLSFGISFSVAGIRAGLPAWVYAAALAASGVMGAVAYRSLLVPPGQTALVVVYTVQAVILLFGGLLSLATGRHAFACIGILLFFSDWLVGLRAFGDPSVIPPFVKDHILILILVTYYIPMAASIEYSFGGRRRDS